MRPQEARLRVTLATVLLPGRRTGGDPATAPKAARVIGVIAPVLSVLRKLALGGGLVLEGPLHFQARDRGTESAVLRLVLWGSEWG